MEEEKVICSYCNKKLIPFKKRTDWIARKYHMKCWQQRFDDFIREEAMAQYLKDHPN
jgi:hypothetical protein